MLTRSPVQCLIGAPASRGARWLRVWIGAMGLGLALSLAGCGGNRPDSGASSPTALLDLMKTRLATSTGGVLLNEVVAGGWNGARDEDGDSEDWVELYNDGDTAANLTGFGLSNKTATPFLWVFPAGTTVPAKGYLTVWLSKKDRTTPGQPLHTNFNLDSGADGVFLTASNATAAGSLVDSATPPLLRHDHSWCRMPSGLRASPFVVCAQATPGAANAGNSQATILATPKLSLSSGFYGSAQTLTITGPAGATLRYTTDGSEPTEAASAYTGPLTIGTSQAVRVAAFAPGAAPSLVMTGTYVIDAARAAQYASLKAMLVTMNPVDLAQFEADNKAWRFRASFEYITGATTQVYRMDGEGVSGGQVGSASTPQRTMNVSGRDAFGAKAFPAAFWPDKPTIKSNRKFRLRNGSNDWGAAHLRDQLSQRLAADGPNLYAASATVAMFINGQYYAMMDLREREEETLPAANLGIDKDWVDYLTDPLLPEQEIKNGGTAALASYQALHTLVTTADLTQAANYARVKAQMNVESFAYNWAHYMFHANYDWPRHNVHVWRSPEVDGRWTWRPHDMDFAFDAYTNPQYNMNASFAEPGSELVNALLKNPEFRTLYLNTVADQMNVMTPALLGTTLDTMAADMRPYIADYYAKNAMGSTGIWETAVDEIRTWYGNREPLYEQHTRSWFGLAPRQPITVAVNDPAMGSVQVNQVDTGKYMTAGRPSWSGQYFPDVPITLQARPKPGYSFVGWQGASTATARQITTSLNAPAAVNFPADGFSVRWRGSVEAPKAGAASLQLVVDDGMRLYFDGQLVIDSWTAKPGATARSADVTLVAGRRHALVVEYFDFTGPASAKLSWRLPGANTYVNVPRHRLYPVGATGTAEGTGTGLTGQYFANASMAGSAAFERTENINVDWGTSAPVPQAAPVVLTAVFAPAGTPAAPVFNAIGAQSGRTGDIVKLVASAVDPGGFAITYSATGLPKGLGMTAKTGVVYGRATTPGTYTSVLTASNGVTTSSQTVVWTISDRPGTGLLGTSPGYETPPPPPPANVAPTVALTTPTANASFSAGSTIGLSATAADADGSIAKVDFYDGSTLIGTRSTAPYSLSWTGATTGTHSLTARATDNSGATTTSAAVPVTVAAVPVNQAPQVAITVPSGNITVGPSTTVKLTATASDADGSIVRVEFYDGGTLLGTRTAAPYSLSGTGALGSHVITAVAVDNLGARSTSAPVTVTIANPGTGAGTGTGLAASYFANGTLSGAPVLTRREAVSFNWGAASPGVGVPADNFSVRWRGNIEAPTAGTYTLQTVSDDGVRVWVNGNLVINNWGPHTATTDTTGSLIVGAGPQRYSIVVEYREVTGSAQVQLRWRTPGSSSLVPVPTRRLYP